MEDTVLGVGVGGRGESGGGDCCSGGVNEEAHFVPRLCEKVRAQEERPQAAAAGRLEGDGVLFKQKVAG